MRSAWTGTGRPGYACLTRPENHTEIKAQHQWRCFLIMQKIKISSLLTLGMWVFLDIKWINLTRGFMCPYMFWTKRKDHNNGLLTWQPTSYWHTLFNTVVSWNMTLQYAKNATWAEKLLHQMSIQVFTSKPSISAHRSSTIQSKIMTGPWISPILETETSIKTLIKSSSWPWFNFELLSILELFK